MRQRIISLRYSTEGVPITGIQVKWHASSIHLEEHKVYARGKEVKGVDVQEEEGSVVSVLGNSSSMCKAILSPAIGNQTTILQYRISLYM
jgi:hypothetical protein